MRLLADENVPLRAIELLRKMGYDVLSISESTPQACDRDVMMIAEAEGLFFSLLTRILEILLSIQ